MTSLPSRLITLKQACELLGVHPNTLRNWEKEGKIASIRIGTRGDRRYTEDTLLRVMNNQPVTA